MRTEKEVLFGWFCGHQDSFLSDSGRDEYEIRTEEFNTFNRDDELEDIISTGWAKDLYTGKIQKVDPEVNSETERLSKMIAKHK